ncbi:hypothetical protein ES703_22464 [subsurface metagenome]
MLSVRSLTRGVYSLSAPPVPARLIYQLPTIGFEVTFYYPVPFLACPSGRHTLATRRLSSQGGRRAPLPPTAGPFVGLNCLVVLCLFWLTLAPTPLHFWLLHPATKRLLPTSRRYRAPPRAGTENHLAPFGVGYPVRRASPRLPESYIKALSVHKKTSRVKKTPDGSRNSTPKFCRQNCHLTGLARLFYAFHVGGRSVRLRVRK